MAIESWVSQIRLLDDAPLDDFADDKLRFHSRLEFVVESIRMARGPMVIHVNGPWGAGKTSFCNLLAAKLGRAEEAADLTCSTIAFVASDEDDQDTNGLLYSIALAVTRRSPTDPGDAEEARRVVEQWGAYREPPQSVSRYRLDKMRDWVERELGWLKVGPASPQPVTIQLPSNAEWSVTLAEETPRLAVVIVDDLDRCSPSRVRAVMNTIRQFVTCRGLVFVIAADDAVVRSALAIGLGPEERPLHTHTEALEKYVRHRVDLSGLADLPADNLIRVVQSWQQLLFPHDAHVLLCGPGPLKRGAPVHIAQSFGRTLTLRRLKRIMNELAEVMASAADSAEIKRSQLVDAADSAGREKRVTPIFDRIQPKTADAFPGYFLGQLILILSRYVWPELARMATKGGDDFLARIIALSSINPRSWNEQLLAQVLDVLCPQVTDLATPFQTKVEFCAWLFDLSCLMGQAVSGSVADRLPIPFYIADTARPQMTAHSVEISRLPRDAGPDGEVPPARASARDVNASRDGGKFLRMLRERTEELLRQHTVTDDDLAQVSQSAETLAEIGSGDPELRRLLGMIAELAENNVGAALRTRVGMGNLAVECEKAGAFDIAYRLYRLLRDNGAFTFDEPGARQVSQYVSFLVDTSHADRRDPGLNGRDARQEARYWLDRYWGQDFINGDTQLQGRFLVSLAKLGGPEASISAHFHTDFEQTPSYERGRNLIAILDARGELDPPTADWILEQISRIPNLTELRRFRLQRAIADGLATDKRAESHEKAIEIYESFKGTALWTPDSIHNLATLLYSSGKDPERAGKLWQLAYSVKPFDPQIRGAFGQYLKREGHLSASLKVLNEMPLDGGDAIERLAGIETNVNTAESAAEDDNE
jgi:hypothetical protein